MKTIEYTGTADFKEYTAADFKKADIEGKKVVFQPGVPVEVDDEIADALTSNEGLFGEELFKEVEAENAEEADSSQPKPKTKTKSVPDNPGATAQEDTGAAATPAGASTTSTSPTGGGTASGL